ncbi:MAG: DUF3846 domain-containing protein [Ruminiclostridium sp.]
MEKEIRVVIIEPGEPSYQKTIPNTLEAFQEIVGGYIEVVTFPDKCCMIVNEEGKYKGLPYNKLATHIYKLKHNINDFVVGTAIIADTREDEFISLDNLHTALYEELK